MFSYETIQKNQARFAKLLPEHDFIYQVAAEECMASLSELSLHPSSILVLGHFPLMEALHATYLSASIDYREGFSPDLNVETTYDIIISMGQLQWINDPLTYLNTLKNMLNSNGVFYSIFPGEDSFKDVHKALIKADMTLSKGAPQRIIPMISASDALNLMQAAHLGNPLVHVVSLELHHNSLIELLNDIRFMGAGNPFSDRSKHKTPKKLFAVADFHLKGRHPYVESTVDLVVMIGRA
jgi:SAM-dependent methyltransferase